MTIFRRFVITSIFAVGLATIGGCSTYSGPGSSIKKGAVYEAQDSAFRRMGN